MLSGPRRRPAYNRRTMRRLVTALLFALTVASQVRAADVVNLTMPLPGGRELLYGLSVPDGYTPGQPRPLLLALHPGGERMRYYGSAYTTAIVAPAAASLGAIIIAPDCPTAAWTDAEAENAVMALVSRIMREYTIDPRRVAVVGYSIGGRGTWFFSSHHRDVFTAAIPMAGSTNEPVETLATMPTYVVHSRRDQVMPFAPAEQLAQRLEQLGRRIHFEALDSPTHFEMGAYVPALSRAVAWVAAQWNAQATSR